MEGYSREKPIQQGCSSLLIVDVQRGFAEPGVGYNEHIDPTQIPKEKQYIFDRVKNTMVPSIQKLLKVCREKKMEVIYTYVEGLTKDCRDHSLDYKISGILVPKGSPGAAILDEVAPKGDEILIPKTACSVFNSTNIEYVLRNLGVTQLVIVGMVTNQCVESAVRDAADRGFLVTVIDDACTANSPEEHERGLKNMKGFARICQTDDVVAEIKKFN